MGQGSLKASQIFFKYFLKPRVRDRVAGNASKQEGGLDGGTAVERLDGSDAVGRAKFVAGLSGVAARTESSASLDGRCATFATRPAV
jgi:hypothetical protein